MAHHRHGGGDPAAGGDDHGDLVGAQAGDGGQDPLRDVPVHVQDGAVDVEGDDEPVAGSEPGAAVGLQGVEVPHPVLDEGVVLLVVQGPTAQGALAGAFGLVGAVLEVLEVLRGAAQLGQGLAGRGDAGGGVDGRAVAGGRGAGGLADGVGLVAGTRAGGGRGVHGAALRRWPRRAR